MSSRSTLSARLFRMSGRFKYAASLFRLWPRDCVPQLPLLASVPHVSCSIYEPGSFKTQKGNRMALQGVRKT